MSDKLTQEKLVLDYEPPRPTPLRSRFSLTDIKIDLGLLVGFCMILVVGGHGAGFVGFILMARLNGALRGRWNLLEILMWIPIGLLVMSHFFRPGKVRVILGYVSLAMFALAWCGLLRIVDDYSFFLMFSFPFGIAFMMKCARTDSLRWSGESETGDRQ